jgi:hypothetical protein
LTQTSGLAPIAAAIDAGKVGYALFATPGGVSPRTHLPFVRR